MALKFFENLSNNYLELLYDEVDFNILINVGESPNTKIFRAHSAILRYRSLYFRNELTNIDKDENNIKTLHLKNVSIQHFEVIIKYIYGGIILLEKYDASFIFELMLIAYEFLLDELAKDLQIHLIKKEAHWLRLRFNRIYQKSFQNNKLQDLQKWCNDFVVKYPNKIFDSEEFFALQENALVSLISRDDLQMEEVKIWNYVIKWGIAQNSGLPSNPEDWSHENFLALKITLQNCLPLIRYFQMSNNDIVNNVLPYQQILEKKLGKDIMKKYMSNESISSTVLPPRIILKPTLPTRYVKSTLPTRNVNKFSTVINEAYAAEIASWVDMRDDTYLITDNPYEFKLLLRGSRDGFTATSFWNLCDKKTNLVVVMKVLDTKEILGGYNPIGWDKTNGDQYMKCKESFIFSLKNVNAQKSILSCANKRSQHSEIFSCPKLGPIFSSGLGLTNNFNLNGKCWTQITDVYEKPIRNASAYKISYGVKTSNFSIKEYEIFQINKKS